MERVEPRELLTANPTYLVFQGTIPAAHGQKTTFAGPIELGPTNFRGETSGTIALSNGSQATVSGLEFAGGVLLKITLPDGARFRASGMGVLRQVAGGDPSKPFTLLGRGDLVTFQPPYVFGGWQT